MANKVDWQQAEHEYVTGSDMVTCGSLGKRLGVTEKCVRDHCSQGGWVEKRRQFRAELTARAEEKTLEAQAEDLVLLNREMGQAFRQAAGEFIVKAREAGRASKARDAKDLMTAAAIGFDKWRLATGQTTGKTEQIVPAEPLPLPVFSEDDPMNHLKGAASDCDGEDDAQAAA